MKWKHPRRLASRTHKYAGRMAEKMEEPRSVPRRRWLPREVSLTSGLLSLPILTALIRTWQIPYFPSSDLAIMQLYQQGATWGIPSTGMYSRYQFHHPGPALYAWVSPFWNAWGARGTLIAAAVFNCLCLLCILWLLHHRGGRPLLLIGATILATLEFGIVTDLISPWNPWMALLPFLLSMELCWCAWCGDRWALPAYLIAISVTVQFHIGFAVVGAVMLLLAAIGFYRNRTQPLSRTTLAWSGVGLFLLWIGPILEQFTADTGNATKIVRAFRDPTDPLAGWGLAVKSSRQALAFLPPWITGIRYDFGGNPIPPSWWSSLPLILSLLLALVVAFRLRRPGVRSLLVGCLLAHGLAMFSVARIQGDAFPYLIRWVWMVSLLSWIAVAWCGYVYFSARVNERSPRLRIGSFQYLGSALLTVVVGAAIYQGTGAHVPNPWGARMVANTIDELTAALPTTEVLAFEYESPGLVHAGIGLMTELEHRGYTVWGPDEYWVNYGRSRVLGNHQATKLITVVTSGEDIQRHFDQGETPVAYWDPLTVKERATFTRINAKVTSIFAGTLEPSVLTSREREQVKALSERGLPIAIFVDQLPKANPKSGAPNTGA